MAGIQSHYEINVSLNGRHFFATDSRSAVDMEDAERLVFEFRKRFPVEQGFFVTCTHWRCGGQNIDFPEFKAEPRPLSELEAENPEGFRNPGE